MMEPSGVSPDLTSKIEELVLKTESLSDPTARELAVDLARAVMDLHAAALEKIVALARTAENGSEFLDAMGSDDCVSAVLALHDVHPHSLDMRLTRTLERLREQLQPGDMDLELMETSPNRVRIRLSGGRPAARAAARHWIQSAIYEAAPQLEDVVIEGVVENADHGFVPIETLLVNREAL
jgi:hypothetical protein